MAEAVAPRGDGEPPAAFYCVSSGMYFVGAVALINSLRLVGHDEPVFVVDSGLSPTQRELMSPQATLVTAPPDTTPFLLKTIAPRRHPAHVMVLIDADMIVTRSLTDLIETAAHDRVLAVEHGQERFFRRWGELLGLGEAAPRTYVSSSLVFAGGAVGRQLLRLMHEAQPRIGIERTPFAVPNPDLASLGSGFSNRVAAQPFFFADQDVLNAVLAAAINPARIDVLDRSAEAIMPFRGVNVVDELTLRCAYADGSEPYALHHYLPVKPWLEPTHPGVYTQLLIRLLHGRDVAIQVPDPELPPHLRRGVAAAARRWYGGRFLTRLSAVRARLAGAANPWDGPA